VLASKNNLKTTMKTQLHINGSNDNNHSDNAAEVPGYLLRKLRRKTALIAGLATGVLFAAQTSPADPQQEIRTVFVIAM